LSLADAGPGGKIGNQVLCRIQPIAITILDGGLRHLPL
jgi:hypothetical protein